MAKRTREDAEAGVARVPKPKKHKSVDMSAASQTPMSYPPHTDAHAKLSAEQLQAGAQSGSAAARVASGQHAVTATSSDKKAEPKKRKRAKSALTTSNLTRTMPKWRLTEGKGGFLLGKDPVFSADEQCLLLGFSHCIKIFSCKNSLLLRSLDVSTDSEVSTFHLSDSDPARVYIGLLNGHVELWDWRQGTRISAWALKSSLSELVVNTSLTPEDSAIELVYTIERVKLPSSGMTEGLPPWRITAHSLNPQSDSQTPSLKTLFKSHRPLTHLHVLDDGKTIAALTGHKILLGLFDSTENSKELSELHFHWREVECSEPATSLAVYQAKSKAGKEHKRGKIPRLDVAVGMKSGAILLYHNLAQSLIEIERKQAERPSVRKLHWHRYPVATLKFSQDADYLLSGGLETVLVSWQLDTGKRQDLPHLTAGLEGLTISPSGTSYAIRLANNSVIALSTLDQHATFSVSGTNWSATASTEAGNTKPQRSSLTDVRACMVVQKGHARMLLAAPASYSTSGTTHSSTSAVYLQTVDTRTGNMLSKQAMTRNNVTDRVSGPDGKIIDDPNLVCVQTSSDSHWLATVDEWTQPAEDVSSGQPQFEVFLKFWSFNEGSDTWELSSRVECPHEVVAGTSRSTAKVLSLVADPSGTGFVSYGTDDTVKLWKPLQRRRHGQPVKDSNGRALSVWTCAASTFAAALDPGLAEQRETLSARLAVSADGSVLALATFQEDKINLILVNVTQSGVIGRMNGIPARLLAGVGIVGKHLVLLTEHLIVWDLARSTLHFTIGLRSHSQPTQLLQLASHLAVDAVNGVFAVAVPSPEASGPTRDRARVAIFDPECSRPLELVALPKHVHALLHGPGGKSFHLIDSSAQVRNLNALSNLDALEIDLLESGGDLNDSNIEPELENKFSALPATSMESLGVAVTASGDDDQGTRITPHALAGIFERGPAVDLLSAFKQIAALSIG